MKNRLDNFLKFNKISSSQLADSLNIQRSRLSHILSGRNKPNLEFIQKMLDTYKTINPRWLILGEGKMFKENESENISFKNTGETDNLFSQSTPTLKKSRKPKRVIERIVKQNKQIKKIVIFYSDQSFENYLPGDNEY